MCMLNERGIGLKNKVLNNEMDNREEKKYKVLLLTEGGDGFKSELFHSINRLKNDDSVISSDSEIEVLTECDNDAEIDVFVGIGGDKAKEARRRAQKAKKPALLCDISCSQNESFDPTTVPYTWGLFSKNNKEMEKAFLEHYNLSFVYAANENLLDYVAPLVFHLLEEFSYHSKYNTNFGYKKQAEFIHEFTQFYLDKMKQLVKAKGFVRDDIKGDFYHIIYRYRPDDADKPFESIDGRVYDFIIEYHRGKPSEGIYYGVKGEVQEGDLEKQCEQFRREWPNIFMKDKNELQEVYKNSSGKDIFWGYNFQLELTEILNNTFPWKNYLKCYKPTDNIWEQRYWLFWVTLNDDEDIIDVAARAVKLMAKTFERCIIKKEEYKAPEDKKNESKKNPQLQKTAFTKEPFGELIEKLNHHLKKLNNQLIDNNETLVEILMREGLIKEDERYECCFICTGNNIASFAGYLKKIIAEKYTISVPWELVERVILPYTRNPSKGTFKSELKNEETRKRK